MPTGELCLHVGQRRARQGPDASVQPCSSPSPRGAPASLPTVASHPRFPAQAEGAPALTPPRRQVGLRPQTCVSSLPAARMGEANLCWGWCPAAGDFDLLVHLRNTELLKQLKPELQSVPMIRTGLRHPLCAWHWASMSPTLASIWQSARPKALIRSGGPGRPELVRWALEQALGVRGRDSGRGGASCPLGRGPLTRIRAQPPGATHSQQPPESGHHPHWLPGHEFCGQPEAIRKGVLPA